MNETARIIYLVMGLVVLAGAVASASHLQKRTGARGPGILVSALIWAGLIALIVLLYRGGEVWTALISLVR